MSEPTTPSAGDSQASGPSRRGRVVVAGGTGFIGSHLIPRLTAAGHEVVVLSRRALPDRDGARFVQWDPAGWLNAGRKGSESWEQTLSGAEAVINLCGASAAEKRWSEARKRVLVDSRTLPSRALVAAANALERPPGAILQAGGVNYYGVGEEPRDEWSPPGDDFLARLSTAWEAPLEETLIRTVVLRFGALLDAGGGALPQMLLPFRLFAGGPVAGGRQWLSWVHVDDAVEAIVYVLHSPLADAVDVTSPHPVRNAEFARAAGRVLHRPAFVPMPRFVITAVLGEGDMLVCDGVQARPTKLENAGFRFQFPHIEDALRDLVG